MKLINYLLILALMPIYQLQAQIDTASIFKANQFFKSQNYDSALIYFEKNKKEMTENIDFAIKYGESLIKTKQFAKAAENLKLQSNLSNEANLLMAEVFANQNNPEKAVEQIEAILKSKNKQIAFQINTLTVFAKLRESAEWDALCQKYFNKFDYALNDAHVELKYNHPERALDILNDITDENSKFAAAWALKSKIYFQQNTYNQALEAINKAIRLDNEPIDYYSLRSEINLNLGNLKEALSDLNKQIGVSNFDVDLLSKRIIIQRKLKNFSAATADNQLLLKFNPSAESLISLGITELENENYFEALKILNQLIETDKSKQLYFVTRGNILMQTKLYEKAEQDYGMALDLNPEGSIFLKHGLARLAAGNITGAVRDFQKAIDYGDNSAWEYLKKYSKEIN